MANESNKPNPYQPPQTNLPSSTEAPLAEELMVGENTLVSAAEELTSAKAWIWVSGFACFCIALSMIVQAYFGIQELGWVNFLVPLAIIVVEVLFYFIYAAQMMNCSATIGSFLEETTSKNLAECLHADALYWKVIGFIFMLSIGLFIVVIGSIFLLAI